MVFARVVRLLLSAAGAASAVHLRGAPYDPAVPHVTYFALTGGGDAAMTEFTLSAFSLCRLSPSVRILLLTDQKLLAPRAIAQLNGQCWDGQEPHAYMRMVNPKDLRARFKTLGFTKFSHHSGLGGYSKILTAELLPETVMRTIVVDTDTVFDKDVAQMWKSFDAFAPGQVMAAKPISVTRCFKPGERLNSGVQLMDVSAMRKSNWSQYVMDKAAGLRSDKGECADCVKGDMLACGDQDLVSFACQQKNGACGQLNPEWHSDHCEDHAGFWHNSPNVVVYHFNCGAKYYKCPGNKCKELVTEFIDQVNPFREFALPQQGRQPWGSSKSK